jgi:hypothetical protein
LKNVTLLLLLLAATGCRTATVEYFWNEKASAEIRCFRTVYIEQRANEGVFETDPALTKAIRKAARGRSLGFHFVDSVERADVVIGVMKSPKVVTTHDDAPVDTTWTMDVASREDSIRTRSSQPPERIMVTGEISFGVSIPKQVMDALELVSERTCDE